MADQIQCNYDEISSVMSRFSEQQDLAQAQYQRIMNQMEVLRGGSWIGPNADTFYNVMENELMPGLQRLINALGEASRTANQVANEFKQAEEEAEGLFPN